jgi:hypothetical protein
MQCIGDVTFVQGLHGQAHRSSKSGAIPLPDEEQFVNDISKTAMESVVHIHEISSSVSHQLEQEERFFGINFFYKHVGEGTILRWFQGICFCSLRTPTSTTTTGLGPRHEYCIPRTLSTGVVAPIGKHTKNQTNNPAPANNEVARERSIRKAPYNITS